MGYFYGFHHFFCKLLNTTEDILQVCLGLYSYGSHKNQPKSALKFTNLGELCRSQRAVWYTISERSTIISRLNWNHLYRALYLSLSLTHTHTHTHIRRHTHAHTHTHA